MFAFQWPWLAALLALPWLVRALFPLRAEASPSSSPEVRFPHLAELRAAYGGAGARIAGGRRWLPLLLFAIWALLVVALMRPQIVDQVSEARPEGHDLMLDVDLSGSMRSLDFSSAKGRVSRLDVAKNVVRDFVEKRAGDRIGLVLFGEHAYLRSPLTADTAVIGKLLDQSASGMAGDATAIGDAIGLSVKNLRARTAPSRAIILLTDGEDNASTIPPLEAARLAKQYGIRIYVIVIGKEGMVPIPDEQGEIVMAESHVDTTLTRKIAEMTGGEFFVATDRAALTRIYDHIDAMEKSPSEARTVLVRKPLYAYPVAAGLLLLGFLGVAGQLRRDSYELQSI